MKTIHQDDLPDEGMILDEDTTVVFRSSVRISYKEGTFVSPYGGGYLHRLDGPAIEWNSGRSYWWYEGQYIPAQSQEEFERLIRLKAFW